MTITKINPNLIENTHASHSDEINRDTTDTNNNLGKDSKPHKVSNLSKKPKTQRYA